MKTRQGRTVVVASLLAALVMTAPLAAEATDDDAPAATMTVVGEGSASASPDTANVNAGVETAADTAAAALSANTEATSALIETLKSAGVAARDIQTANFSVQPRYARYDEARPDAPPQILGYTVQNEVRFTIRDLDSLGGLLDRLIGAGANRINNVGFAIDDDTALTDEARRAAVADARRKAELFAAASGVKLGRILRIDETGDGGPTPMPALRMERMASANLPIERGENTVAARLAIVWEISASGE